MESQVAYVDDSKPEEDEESKEENGSVRVLQALQPGVAIGEDGSASIGSESSQLPTQADLDSQLKRLVENLKELTLKS